MREREDYDGGIDHVARLCPAEQPAGFVRVSFGECCNVAAAEKAGVVVLDGSICSPARGLGLGPWEYAGFEPDAMLRPHLAIVSIRRDQSRGVVHRGVHAVRRVRRTRAVSRLRGRVELLGRERAVPCFPLLYGRRVRRG